MWPAIYRKTLRCSSMTMNTLFYILSHLLSKFSSGPPGPAVTPALLPLFSPFIPLVCVIYYSIIESHDMMGQPALAISCLPWEHTLVQVIFRYFQISLSPIFYNDRKMFTVFSYFIKLLPFLALQLVFSGSVMTQSMSSKPCQTQN